LKWESGVLDYYEVTRTLQRETSKYKTLFVKGMEKQIYLLLFQNNSRNPNTDALNEISNGEHDFRSPLIQTGLYNVAVCIWGPVVGVGAGRSWDDACEVAAFDILQKLCIETEPLRDMSRP